MSLKAFVLLLSAVASVSALHTPRNVPHHRALARANVAAPVQPVTPKTLRRRANGKRCKPRPSSSVASSVVPSSSVVVSSTSEVVSSTSVVVSSSSEIVVTSSSVVVTPTESSSVSVTPSASSVEVVTTSSTPPVPTTSSVPPPPTTTSSPPPTTSSSPPPAPTTTSTPPPAPTTSSAPPPPPAPTTTSTPPPPPAPTKPSGGGGLPSFMVGVQAGQGTFYDTGLGACGIVNRDTDYIAAVSHLLFDNFPGYNGQNPNKNPMCGRRVRVTYRGKSIVVALTDRCEACAQVDLDLSPSAFSELAAFGTGRINLEWEWL